MGQAIRKSSTGAEGEAKGQTGNPKVKAAIENYCRDLVIEKDQLKTAAEFYHAICKAVEEINKELGGTQIRLPEWKSLEKIWEENEPRGGKKLGQDKFADILRKLIPETGVVGGGTRDIVMYIFGIPIASLLLKKSMMPDAISDEIFIPGVTSATVFVLANLNKI